MILVEIDFQDDEVMQDEKFLKVVFQVVSFLTLAGSPATGCCSHERWLTSFALGYDKT